MKAKLLFAALLMGSLALASDPVNLARSYRKGEKDTYSLHIKMNTSAGAIDITMNSVQSVLQVYPNGDADIETTISDLVVDGFGLHQTPEPGKPTTARMDKYGAAVDTTSIGTGKPPVDLNFLRLANVLGEPGLASGKPVSIDRRDPKNPKTRVTGSAVLAGHEGGVSRVKASLDITTEQTGTSPLHVESMTLVGQSGKVNRAEAKITHLPQSGGLPADSVEVTSSRKE